MDPNTPSYYTSSYKRFVPSRKIQLLIVILIIIGIGYFTLPPLINHFFGPKPIVTKNLQVGTPTGDPSTRDTLGDGIPDWEKIAVGLNPSDPNSTKLFQKLQQTLGTTNLNQAFGTATDTDKVSLTISSDLSTITSQKGLASGTDVANSTSQEVLSYIDAHEKQNQTFTAADIKTTDDSLTSNTAYYNALKPLLSDTPTTKAFPQKLNDYINGTGTKEDLAPGLDYLNTTIQTLKGVSVPRSVVALHLQILTDTNGLLQTINGIDPTNSDEMTKMSNISLVQDYLIKLTKEAGKLSIFFSVALNKDAYSN